MYLSPLVDRVVKPAKPLANFGIELQGTQVTFQNRSLNGSQGWWDFGDGSPLEPFNPQQTTVSHAYPRPGAYTAKLSVQSLFGEESERTVNVQLDAPAAGPPEIATLEVASARTDTYAPATFRVLGKVHNAELCVWACGADQPLELETDPPASEERVVTFKKPGQHVIRLAAVQGKRVVERTATVQVLPPPVGTAMAVLNVIRDAVQVRKVEQHRNIPLAFPDKNSGNTYAFSQEVPAGTGWQITAARLGRPPADPSVKDVKLTVARDGSKVVLTGEMVRQTGVLGLKRNAPLPRWVAEVILTQERHEAPCQAPMGVVAKPLALPGSTLVPLPKLQSGWVQQKCRIGLDLYDGGNVVQQNAAVPTNEVIRLGNRSWRLTATEVGDQVRIDATAMPGLSGN
jgi:hypothetical protein